MTMSEKKLLFICYFDFYVFLFLSSIFKNVGAVCFFRGKMSAVCGPYLQTSAAEEVDQTYAVYQKKTVCFLTSASC
ncbi:hypothetical protein Hanom_Chr09g00833021 [Helianthus anomalus]